MFKRFALDNGIRLLVNELPHTRSVTLGYYIGIGSRYESDEVGGVSHFIEHMLFKGTSRRPTAQHIAVAIEGIGGAFNAGTSHEFTNYWVKVAYQHLDTAIDVLSDMLRASLFQAEEIEKERRVIIEEINQTFDTPDDLVFFDLDELMWPGHPLGRDIAGSPETVSRLTREQLCDYMAETYTAPNIVVSVAGMVEADAVRLKIDQALGGFPSGARRSFVKFESGQGERRWKVRHKKTEQAHVAVSTWSYPRNHPDRFVVSLLHSVLGDGMSSRLFQEIREKRGLAYSVSAFGASHEDCGHLGSYAAVEPRNAAPTLRAILHEWGRLRDELVPEDELTKAKELVKGHLLLSMEDTHAVAGWYGRQEVLDQEILSVDDVTAEIDAVQAEDIRRVARDLFRDEWLNLTVVGPFRQEGRLVKSLALQ